MMLNFVFVFLDFIYTNKNHLGSHSFSFSLFLFLAGLHCQCGLFLCQRTGIYTCIYIYIVCLFLRVYTLSMLSFSLPRDRYIYIHIYIYICVCIYVYIYIAMSDVSQDTGSDLSVDRALPAFFSLHLAYKNSSLAVSLARARSFSLLPTFLHSPSGKITINIKCTTHNQLQPT